MVGGAISLIAGIAAFIEAHSHRPEVIPNMQWAAPPIHVGLTPTAYDLLRIGAWALVVIGALLIVMGLIRYWGEHAART